MGCVQQGLPSVSARRCAMGQQQAHARYVLPQGLYQRRSRTGFAQ
jgi:hypothetical protein